MYFDLYPQGKPLVMLLSIKPLKAVKLRVTVYDKDTHRIYADRSVLLKAPKIIRLKLPITPEVLTAKIVDEHLDAGHKTFIMERINIRPDMQCPVELSEADRNFIRFIKWFAVGVGELPAGEKGTLYQSEGFSILLMDTLKEGTIELTTPARIARDSGMIEVSKTAIRDYTVPMLIVMLLHEYAHKFKNPEYGKDIANEVTADIIAVHIALNLGLDGSEVENCYRTIFAKKDTPLNKRRMSAILEFIRLFVSNESKRCKVPKS